MLKQLTRLLALAGLAYAQRPADVSICDYYTGALLTNVTAANEETLLTLVVNTALIGNYTQPNVGVVVTGILNPGYYQGVYVNLLPYFDGSLLSTNNMGVPSSVNFLDGGGAAPLLMNMPANNTSSNQYTLVTRLYEYFGVLLGCSKEGMPGYPSYDGSNSMYEVHKFMALDMYEVGWFIQQVGLAAASFGVAAADVNAVGMALTTIFDYKCAPPQVVVPYQPAALQAICIAEDCMLEPDMPECWLYAPAMPPKPAMMSSASPTSSMKPKETCYD